jgi:hypothetical protein
MVSEKQKPIRKYMYFMITTCEDGVFIKPLDSLKDLREYLPEHFERWTTYDDLNQLIDRRYLCTKPILIKGLLVVPKPVKVVEAWEE